MKKLWGTESLSNSPKVAQLEELEFELRQPVCLKLLRTAHRPSNPSTPTSHPPKGRIYSLMWTLLFISWSVLGLGGFTCLLLPTALPQSAAAPGLHWEYISAAHWPFFSMLNYCFHLQQTKGRNKVTCQYASWPMPLHYSILGPLSTFLDLAVYPSCLTSIDYIHGLSCPLVNGKYDQETRGEEKRKLGYLFLQLLLFPVTAGWLDPSPAGLCCCKKDLPCSLVFFLFQSPLLPHPFRAGKGKEVSLLSDPGFCNILCGFPIPCHTAINSSSMTFLICPNWSVLSVPDWCTGYPLTFCMVHCAVIQVSWDWHREAGRSLVVPLLKKKNYCTR